MTGHKQKKKLHRIPKVIADELESAIRATEAFAGERLELLARYRRNRIRRIATWGIGSIGEPVEGLELIPLECISGIETLDAALGKLHRFKSGGAGDYVAKDVGREINRCRASGPRKPRDEQQKEICQFLQKRDYMSQENKKAIRIAAMERFGVCEKTVYRAIEKGKLLGIFRE